MRNIIPNSLFFPLMFQPNWPVKPVFLPKLALKMLCLFPHLSHHSILGVTVVSFVIVASPHRFLLPRLPCTLSQIPHTSPSRPSFVLAWPCLSLSQKHLLPPRTAGTMQQILLMLSGKTHNCLSASPPCTHVLCHVTLKFFLL